MLNQAFCSAQTLVCLTSRPILNLLAAAETSPERVVASVASFLDLPSAHPDRDVINVKIQRDALTEEWHTRFLSERGCVSSIELLCSSD